MKIFNSILIFITGIILTAYLISCSSATQTTGKLAFQQGDYKKAEVEFEKEVKDNPSNEEAWYYLGATKIMLGKFDDAQKAFDQYRKIGKNSYANEILDAWIIRFNLGADNFENAQKSANPDDQLKFYNKSIDEFKTCYIIQPDSTVVLQYIKNINNKIALLKIKPFIDKGVELLEKGDFEGAVNEFNKALNADLPKENPNYYVVQYNTGVAYLKWGEKIRMVNQETNPDDKSHLEKYQAALPFLEELTLSPDDKDKLTAYELLVQVYGNLNMQEKALDAIKKRDELREKLKQ